MYKRPRLNKVLLITLKLIVYFAVFATIHQTIRWISGESHSYISFIIAMFIIVTRPGQLTILLQKIIDRSFYVKLYDLKKAVRSLDQQLDTTIDDNEIGTYLSAFLDKTFSEEGYTLFIVHGNHCEPFRKTDFSTNGELMEPAVFPATRFNSRNHRQKFYRANELPTHFPDIKDFLEKRMQHRNYGYFLPLLTNNQMSGFLLFDKEHLDHYTTIPEIRDFLLELFQKTAYTLESSAIHSSIKRKSLESQLLLETVRSITATLNLEEVLEKIIENVSHLVQYDAMAIFLIDEKQKILKNVVSRGYNRERLALVPLKMGQGISGEVIREGVGKLIPDVSETPNYYPARLSTRSQITVPIISRDSPIGALTVESNRKDHFNYLDLELLTLFSGLAAIAIRNAQLYGDSLTKKRMESDLLIASKVQKALLPRRAPTIDGLEIDLSSTPSLYVGGDLYDVFPIGKDRQGIAIGDGSGKGTTGAILMAVAYAGFKSLFNEMDTVATLVARLNNFLAEATTPGYYVTFFFGILNRSEMEFTYSNAGHNPPILMREDKSWEYLLDGGMVAGFLSNQKYIQKSVPVKSGDYLIFYTDGVTEIQNYADEEYGEDRLIAVLKKHYGKAPRDIRIKILEDVRRFSQRRAFQDDLTLVIVRIK